MDAKRQSLNGDYLTTAAVAREVRRTRKTVTYWCRTKRLPSIQVGRDYLIRRADLASLVPPPGMPGVAPPRKKNGKKLPGRKASAH